MRREQQFATCSPSYPVRFSKKDWLLVAILLVLMILLFWETMPTNKTLFGTDTFSQASIFSRFGWSYFNQHFRLPGWNPYIFSGMPFKASFSLNITPFDMLIYPFRILDIKLPSSSYLIFYLMLGGLGIYVFLKGIGCARLSAFAGAISFAFSNFLISRVYPGHGSKIVVACHVPFGFFFLSRGLDTRKPIYFVWFGVVIGLQYLNRHPQVLYYSLLLYGFYLIYRLLPQALDIKQRRNALILAAFFVGALILGGMLAANTFLPNYVYKNYSIRGGDKDAKDSADKWKFATSWSLPPEELLGLFIRNPFGWKMEESFGQDTKRVLPYRGRMGLRQALEYLGAMPVVLILFSIFFKRSYYVRFFSWTTMGIIILAMGKYTPIYKLVYWLIPGFSMFRVPLMIFTMAVFATACLVGLGFESLFYMASKEDKTRLLRFCKYMFVGIALLFVIFGILWLARDNLVILWRQSPLILKMIQGQVQELPHRISYFLSKAFLALLLLSLATLIILVRGLLIDKDKAKNASIGLQIAVILFMIIDLWSLNSQFIIAVDKKDLKEYYQPTNAIPILLKDNEELFRVFSSRVERYPNEYMLHGIHSLTGYHAAFLSYYKDLISSFSQFNSVGEMLNCKYLVLPNTATNIFHEYYKGKKEYKYLRKYRLILERNFLIYYNTAYQPRVWVCYNAYNATDKDSALKVLSHPDYDPEEVVVFHDRFPASLRLPDPRRGAQLNGRAEITSFEPDRLTARAQLQDHGLVVFSEIWYPGWKAYVNGSKRPIYRVNYALRALNLPPGDHRIEMVFEPLDAKIGWCLTVVALVIIVSLTVITTIKGRD